MFRLSNFIKIVSVSLAVPTLMLLAADQRVYADAVTDWNARAVQYSSVPGFRPGPTWVLDVAVVQVAIYDAVQAIEGDYETYCGSYPGASGSTAAAAATAARDVLVLRIPNQALSIELDYLAYVAGIDPADPGFAVGHAAAACVNGMRAGDGAFPVGYPPFIGGTLPGEWRPVASGPLTFGWAGSVRPFTVRSSDQFRAGPPPALTSPEYTRAYNEVKSLGSATGSGRSSAQTDLANFWNGNFPGQMNKLARDLVSANSLNISESSRLLALADLAMADSLITVWADKVHYNFWRPITAIRLGHTDGNPKTEGDPNWTPLVGTPPYPDHTSGANGLVASATRSFSLFFGTNEMEFSIVTTNPAVTDPTKRTRSYQKFSEVRDEVEDARILEGIHFRPADADGRRQAEHIAQWAHAHFFRPVD